MGNCHPEKTNVNLGFAFVDIGFLWVGNCHPEKTNVNLSFSSVDIGFLGVTISHVTLSCSQYLYEKVHEEFLV